MPDNLNMTYKYNIPYNFAIKTGIKIILFATLIFSACDIIDVNDEIRGDAFIVDNFIDKNPLEGLYIEIEYTRDEGYTYDFLTSSITDNNGYFEIDEKIENSYLCIDCWTVANVYSDTDYSDTLGHFGFQFFDDTHGYKTIHLDTFSLSHNIWVMPRIGSLGDLEPDEISIDFYNCELIDTSLTNMTFYGAVDVNQTFTPVEIKMTMNIQHWLSYGTRELAWGSLKKDSQQIGIGSFRLEDSKHTIEGDTLYLNLDIVEAE